MNVTHSVSAKITSKNLSMYSFIPDSPKLLLLYLIMELNILNNLDIEYHSVCLSQANTQRHIYEVIYSHHL